MKLQQLAKEVSQQRGLHRVVKKSYTTSTPETNLLQFSACNAKKHHDVLLNSDVAHCDCMRCGCSFVLRMENQDRIRNSPSREMNASRFLFRNPAFFSSSSCSFLMLFFFSFFMHSQISSDRTEGTRTQQPACSASVHSTLDTQGTCLKAYRYVSLLLLLFFRRDFQWLFFKQLSLDLGTS